MVIFLGYGYGNNLESGRGFAMGYDLEFEERASYDSTDGTKEVKGETLQTARRVRTEFPESWIWAETTLRYIDR